MKNKNLETLLYSTVGVAAMFLLLVGLNIALGVVKQRVDLTADKAFTLSAGTRAILGKVETPVKIRFYCTQVENATPESVFLAAYAKQVEDLLGEFRQQSGGKVLLEKLDPQPDSDAEDSAKLDGLEGQPMPPYGEGFYLGMAISQLDERVVIPFLSPTRERLLEYDIARAISQVTAVERPVVGVMSALPVFGAPMNPMMMQMGRQQGQDPWIFLGELKRDFTVREVPMTAEAIDADVTVLVVIHPREITEAAQYAIDQFVLRGGKLMAFLDPLSIADNRSGGMNPLQRATASGSTMEKLLKAWGVEFDVAKCVSDMTYKTRLARQGGAEEAPAVLSLTKEAMSADDPVVGQLDNLLLPYAGVFTGTPATGLKQAVLVKTSKNAMLIDKVMAEFSGGADKDFKAAGTEYALALRLTGTFKTAFPEGKPGSPVAEEKPEGAAGGETAGVGLKESKQETTVILVGDSDVLFDPVVAQVQNLFGQKIVIPQNGNLNFAQSLVEQVAGDSNLIAVRSRASLNRPFTVVRKMEEAAQDTYRSRIRDLETGLQETQQKLNELQRTKQEGQRFILSPEQQAELEKFRQQEATARRDLKEMRRNLRRDVDWLEAKYKMMNIAMMPLAVTLSGILVALYKRKKTAAQ